MILKNLCVLFIAIQKVFALILHYYLSLPYTIYRQYNTCYKTVSKNKKNLTFESGELYENYYEKKIS